jgi:hypothetical protein
MRSEFPIAHEYNKKRGAVQLHDFISTVSPVLSLASVIITLLVGYGTLKARRDAPDKAWRDDLAIWRIRVDEKLDNDNHKIKNFERLFEKNEDFQRITLRTLKGVLRPFSTEEDKDKISKEIDDFLIER